MENRMMIKAIVYFCISAFMWTVAMKVGTGEFPFVEFWTDAVSFISHPQHVPIAAELFFWNALYLDNASIFTGIPPAIYADHISFRSISTRTRVLDKSYECFMNLAEYPDHVVFQNTSHTCTKKKCERKNVHSLWRGMIRIFFLPLVLFV